MRACSLSLCVRVRVRVTRIARSLTTIAEPKFMPCPCVHTHTGCSVRMGMLLEHVPSTFECIAHLAAND
jgi:hypothetical protein